MVKLLKKILDKISSKRRTIISASAYKAEVQQDF